MLGTRRREEEEKRGRLEFLYFHGLIQYVDDRYWFALINDKAYL